MARRAREGKPALSNELFGYKGRYEVCDEFHRYLATDNSEHAIEEAFLRAKQLSEPVSLADLDRCRAFLVKPDGEVETLW